jgi:hypothetical protein
MKRLFSFLFWSFLFLVACVGLDQLLMRVAMPLPVLAEVRTFYVDFRPRLLHLAQRTTAATSPSAKKAAPPRLQQSVPVLPMPKAAEPPSVLPRVKKSPAATSSPAAEGEAKAPHYLYVDGKGALLFADRLEEIPPAYRKDVQRLTR